MRNLLQEVYFSSASALATRLTGSRIFSVHSALMIVVRGAHRDEGHSRRVAVTSRPLRAEQDASSAGRVGRIAEGSQGHGVGSPFHPLSRDVSVTYFLPRSALRAAARGDQFDLTFAATFHCGRRAAAEGRLRHELARKSDEIHLLTQSTRQATELPCVASLGACVYPKTP